MSREERHIAFLFVCSFSCYKQATEFLLLCFGSYPQSRRTYFPIFIFLNHSFLLLYQMIPTDIQTQAFMPAPGKHRITKHQPPFPSVPTRTHFRGTVPCLRILSLFYTSLQGLKCSRALLLQLFSLSTLLSEHLCLFQGFRNQLCINDP